MPHQVIERQPRDRAPLVRGDRFTRLSKRTSFPRLHFHEHHRLAVPGDDVQFSTAAAVTPGNNCVPAPLEFFTSQIFAGISERDACVCHETHARARVQPPLSAESAEDAKDNFISASFARSAVHLRGPSTSVSASPKICTAVLACALVSTSGGEKRIAFLPAPSSSSPRRNAALSTASRSVVARSLVCRSRTSSTPIISPRPRTSPTSGWPSDSDLSPAIKCAPTSAALAISVSFRSLIVASAAAHDTGFPPN